VRHQTIAAVIFSVLFAGWSSPSFAQADPYTTNLGLRYDFFSHAFEESSGAGFNVDVTRMLGGFTGGGGWGVGGGIDIEHFASATLKEFEGYAAVQGRATGQKQMGPFGRLGIGVVSDSGDSNVFLDFRGGVDFKLKPDSPFLISAMISIKHVLVSSDIEGLDLGFNVLRLSAGVVLPLNK